MLSYENATFGYTATGSLKWKAENGDTTWYDYDLLGNLCSVQLPNNMYIQYLIDGQNRRVGKIVNGSIKKRWLYQNQLNIVAELDSAGNLTSRFVYGTKGHVPDYMVKNDITYRFITDHLGSVRLVVDVASGVVVQYITYDEFGNILTDTNPGFQPFGYAGGLYDRQTGLVRFGARDYDAVVGRWMRKDPIKFSGIDKNFFVYCLNNPIDYYDDNGLTITFHNKKAEAALKSAYDTIGRTKRGREIIKIIEDSPIEFNIYFESAPGPRGGSAYIAGTRNIYIDPCTIKYGFYTWQGENRKPGFDWNDYVRVLAHELGHVAIIPGGRSEELEYQYERLNILFNENPIMLEMGGAFNDPELTYKNRIQ
jgi:RHS repeat-associated protein